MAIATVAFQLWWRIVFRGHDKLRLMGVAVPRWIGGIGLGSRCHPKRILFHGITWLILSECCRTVLITGFLYCFCLLCFLFKTKMSVAVKHPLFERCPAQAHSNMNTGESSRFCWVTQRLQHNFKMNKQFSKMLGCLK